MSKNIEICILTVLLKYLEQISHVKYNIPIQDGPFGGCSRIWGRQKGPLSKILQTYPTMMKLDTITPYLKKTQKMYE